MGGVASVVTLPRWWLLGLVVVGAGRRAWVWRCGGGPGVLQAGLWRSSVMSRPGERVGGRMRRGGEGVAHSMS